MYIQQKYDNTNYSPPAPIVEVRIKPGASPDALVGTSLAALIDSGADATMLPEALLVRIGAERIDRRRSRGVYGHARMVNIYLVDVQIGTAVIPSVKAVGVSGDDEPLVGRDILNQLIVTLDGIDGRTEIS